MMQICSENKEFLEENGEHISSQYVIFILSSFQLNITNLLKMVQELLNCVDEKWRLIFY
ncbi:MAG: hypothetical protein QG591_2368 [Planctomycetota bacterium]|nr:hypothetical protein [Planctomycetota bacterium]